MSRGRAPPAIDGMYSLKVDNLTYRTTIDDLRRAFEKYGDVGDVYIPRDRYSRESRGFAFVRFYDKRDAEDAMDAMDRKHLDGRELRVQMARYGRPASPPRRSGGSRSHKRRGSHTRSTSRDRGSSRSPRRRRERSHQSASRSRSRSVDREETRVKQEKRRSPSAGYRRSSSKSPRGIDIDRKRVSRSPSKHSRSNSKD